MKYAHLIVIPFFSVCIFINFSLTAQTINQISNNHFQYQGQEYKYQDMGHIFSQNREASDHFILATRKLKTGKTLGIISLSSLGLGIILIAAEGECDFIFGSDHCRAGILGAVSVVILFPATGITALIFRGSGKRNKRKSIDLFNQAYGIQLPKDNPVELNLIVKNGLGLQLKF